MPYIILVYKDIKNYPSSAFGEIHKRIGEEINMHKVRRLLKEMVDGKKLSSTGTNRWTRYSIEQNPLESH
jgi:ATP-dependent DNA helicase RecG